MPSASRSLAAEDRPDVSRELDDMRAGRDEYKQAADALARVPNISAIENDELRRKAGRTGQFNGPRPLPLLHAQAPTW